MQIRCDDRAADGALMIAAAWCLPLHKRANLRVRRHRGDGAASARPRTLRSPTATFSAVRSPAFLLPLRLPTAFTSPELHAAISDGSSTTAIRSRRPPAPRSLDYDSLIQCRIALTSWLKARSGSASSVSARNRRYAARATLSFHEIIPSGAYATTDSPPSGCPTGPRRAGRCSPSLRPKSLSIRRARDRRLRQRLHSGHCDARANAVYGSLEAELLLAVHVLQPLCRPRTIVGRGRWTRQEPVSSAILRLIAGIRLALSGVTSRPLLRHENCGTRTRPRAGRLPGLDRRLHPSGACSACAERGCHCLTCTRQALSGMPSVQPRSYERCRHTGECPRTEQARLYGG